MNFFESILLYSILILFPLLIYLIYLSTNKTLEKNSKSLFLSLAIISSFYLLYKSILYTKQTASLLILNIPILIAYLEKKYLVGNILLIVILFIFHSVPGLYIILFGYILCFIFLLLKNKYNISNNIYTMVFILLNLICFVLKEFIYKYYDLNIIKLLVLIILYILISLIVSLIYIIGDKIIKDHMTFKELQEEKQIRLSLFKITHEIKNPIAVIKGYLDMMDLTNTKQMEKYIIIIKGEIDRLLGLLQDFLLVNKSKMDLDIMDICMLIEETLEKINAISVNNNVTINYEPKEEIFINGDYNRLQQVLINIIKNSIESIDENTKGIINIEVKENSNKVKIIITDNGSGIDKKIINKIREPFFTTKQRGSGLGVSLSYEIIEAHNGKISYFSEKFKGTKVEIDLPIYE